jgi:hypothetical protein
MKPRTHFEWTISTRGRDRACLLCRKLTPAFFALPSGVRKPVCSTCFFTRFEEALAALRGDRGAPAVKKPSSSSPGPIPLQEQLRLC